MYSVSHNAPLHLNMQTPRLEMNQAEAIWPLNEEDFCSTAIERTNQGRGVVLDCKLMRLVQQTFQPASTYRPAVRESAFYL